MIDRGSVLFAASNLTLILEIVKSLSFISETNSCHCRRVADVHCADELKLDMLPQFCNQAHPNERRTS